MSQYRFYDFLAEKNIDEIIAERLETMDKSLNEVSKVITEIRSESAMMSYLILTRQKLAENCTVCENFPVKNK